MVSITRAPRSGIPVLLSVQASCHTCGHAIRDPVTLEQWGRYCSPRCYYARDLPALLRQGA